MFVFYKLNLAKLYIFKTENIIFSLTICRWCFRDSINTISNAILMYGTKYLNEKTHIPKPIELFAGKSVCSTNSGRMKKRGVDVFVSGRLVWPVCRQESTKTPEVVERARNLWCFCHGNPFN